MNKHKLKPDDLMKCPTCDTDQKDTAKACVAQLDAGKEFAATDECEECTSLFTVWHEDGFVYAEEV
jgi:hypothetical protein